MLFSTSGRSGKFNKLTWAIFGVHGRPVSQSGSQNQLTDPPLQTPNPPLEHRLAQADWPTGQGWQTHAHCVLYIKIPHN